MRALTSFDLNSRLAFAVLGIAMLGGCSGGQPGPGTPAPTGITANNGGGVNTLNNQPNIGVTTVVRP